MGNKGCKYDSEGHYVDGLFAKIIRGDLKPKSKYPAGWVGKIEGNELLYKDEHVSVFVPSGVAASLHYLVIPNKWVRNVNSFLKADKEGFEFTDISFTNDDHKFLLNHMKQVGIEMLDKNNPDKETRDIEKDYLFLFHKPPYNSVDHLHLHCIRTPFLSWMNSAKYSTSAPWTCTFDDVISKL